jgi:hypothetical protein
VFTAGLLVAGIGSLALIARELRKAPEGYEDDHGFYICKQEPSGDNEDSEEHIVSWTRHM